MTALIYVVRFALTMAMLSVAYREIIGLPASHDEAGQATPLRSRPPPDPPVCTSAPHQLKSAHKDQGRCRKASKVLICKIFSPWQQATVANPRV